ncbi:MAG: ATP-binding protein [Velocimicrobium sp.]
MKQAEERAIILRHDLRHHLHLINGYLMTDNIKKAKSYLSEIEKNIYEHVITKYCTNEAVNLILSSYINMARNEGITVQTQVSISETCEIADMDLCVILANAIENAIHACINIKDSTDRTIHISCLSKNQKLLIQISNNFTGVVTFKNDMPVTEEQNHGFGTTSIAATVQKYNGIYSFTAEEYVFKLNIIL